MYSRIINRTALVIMIMVSVIISLSCSEEKTVAGDPGPRIIGDLNQAAQLYDVVQPEDCVTNGGVVSALTGKLNNVDLNNVKIVMYTESGGYYGTIRVFADDGTFSMDLPCDRRVRLVLAEADWNHASSYSNGPPAVADPILGVFWGIDRVVGSINGLVRDAFDNSFVEGVAVSWSINGDSGQATTDADGYYAVGSIISSGSYDFVFKKTGYPDIKQAGVIPSLDSLKGSNNYPGDIDYVESMEVYFPPLTSSLSGYVQYIDPGTLDTLPAQNVEVQLMLGERVIDNLMKDTTDVNGYYSFDPVPTSDSLTMTVPAFVLAANTYGPVDSTLVLLPGQTVINALLSSGGGGSYRLIKEPSRR